MKRYGVLEMEKRLRYDWKLKKIPKNAAHRERAGRWTQQAATQQ